MPIFVNDAGALREIAEVFVNDNGTLREIQEGYVNDNGTLRQFFTSLTVVLGGFSQEYGTDSSGETVVSGVRFGSDGKLYKKGPTGATHTEVIGQWISNPSAGIGANYDVRCASISAGAWGNSGAPLGDYVRMDVDRDWSVTVISKNSPDFKTCSATFEIVETGQATVLDSGLITSSARN